MRLLGLIPDHNAPRFHHVDDHVESWFWRINHPTVPRAIWIKATVLKPANGTPTADVWCTHFDGDAVSGHRETVPLTAACFSDDARPLRIEIAGAHFSIDVDHGRLTGQIGDLAWDLSFERTPGRLADPLCLFPSRRLLVAPLPRFKLVTPLPSLTVSGTVEYGGVVWQVDRWPGAQGHNWGPEHAVEYAWGQCTFADADGPAVLVEGVSARIRLAGRLTPWLSALVVRRGTQRWRFDRLIDTWNHTVAIDDMRWVLRIRGRAGEAVLTMSAAPAQMACLGYKNPNGRLSYCMNSKLARVTLRINPRLDDAFECHSEHGGALEFLRAQPDPRLGAVI